MKKRLVSILLVLVMVLGMLPTVAFAADTAPTEISSAEEFAAMTATAGSSYILTKDITVTTPYSKDFKGTFDGNGHTITLNITATAVKSGLFASLAGGAVIKNVITAGSINAASYNNVGGIVGQVSTATGTVTIQNCKNTANILGKQGVGGIVGYAYSSKALIIENCGNTGTISSTDASGGRVGGIGGNLLTTVVSQITNCFNQGTIESKASNSAGLVGYGQYLTIKNCYSTGSVSGSYTTATICPSGQGNVTLENCYALEGTSSFFYRSNGATKDDASGFEDEETMKSTTFAQTLGSGFMYKAGDYPALSWETPKATKVFKITPAAAKLEVYDQDEDTIIYTGTGAEHTVALPAGTYGYDVTCDGYEDVNGSDIVVSAEDAEAGKALDEVVVTMKEDASAWTTISVTKDPASTVVTIKDASGAAVSAQADGSYKLLKTGKYTYTATTTDEGYEAVSGDVDLTASTLDVVLPQVTGLAIKTAATKTEYYQGDAIDTTGLEVTISYKSGDTLDVAAADFASKGIKVSFSSAVVSDDVTVTISYKGQSATYKVSVADKPMPSTLFNGLKGYATVEYSSSNETKIPKDKAFVETTKDGETVLKSNSYDVNSSTVTITIKFASELPTSNFIFDYKTSSEKNYDYFSVNGSTSKTLSGEIDWTRYALSVKPGDTLTLAYTKDSSSKSGDDCVYLRNFGFAFNATFNVTTEGATVTLKNKDTGAAISGTDNKFVVTPGTYEYTVSKFGYVSETGEFTITKADFSKDVTLKEGSKQKVTLNIAIPEDAIGDYTLTVQSGSDYSDTKTSSEKKVELELTPASYTYTITHPDCKTATGTFTVGESAQSIDIELVRAVVFRDFFANCVGITAENHERRPWKIVEDQTNGNYLTTEGVSTGYGSSYLTTITLTATDNVRLSFDVTPYCYGSSYRFVIAKNGTTVKSYDRSDKWESYTIDLNKGDVLTLTFTPYGTSYYTRLKNFQSARLATIDFATDPADAAITVKNADGTVVNPASGTTYVLSEGEYTYTASKFGYEDVEGEFTVEGGKDKTITVPALPELPKFGVAFGITMPNDCQDDGYTVTIKQGTTVAYTGSDVSCKLPAGDYTYTVSSPKCESATGSFTVKGNMAIRVTLERKLVFADFFPSGVDAVNDAANPYKIVTSDDGNYLTTQGYSSYGEYTITLTFTKGGLFSFDYYGDPYNNQYYPFTVKNGSETLLTSYNSAEWKEFRTVVEAGDVLTLTSKQMSNTSCYVHLKNFKLAGANTVSFTVETEDAVLTVKDADGKTIAPSEGTTYELSDGTYTYTVSKFGFAAAEETFTVAGADLTITVPALKALDTKKITFQLTPASAVVTVSHAVTGAQTANDNGEYELFEGETYTYTVTCEGYGEKSGTITVTDDEMIEVTLAFLGTAWDGTSTTKPAGSGTVSDPYQISNGAELAWFASEVNGGKYTICAKLTDDINLGNQTWTPIGNYYSDYSSKYNGTFDGGFHTISGLKATTGGLFGYLNPLATVKNLTVSGDVSGESAAGMISYASEGTIDSCAAFGTVTVTGSGFNFSGGGIVGRGVGSSNVIRNCANAATIINNCTSYSTELSTGGIVGYTYGTVENCYSTGDVKARTDRTNKALGGLVGYLRSGAKVVNCYSAGTVTGPADGIGAFIGSNSGTISGSFYRSNAAAKAVATGSSTGLTAKTEAEMKDKSFIREDLGMKLYHVDTDAINGGYPVLAWQGGSEVVITDDEKYVTLDLQALTLRDLDLAETIETLRAQADEEVEDMVADLTLSELNEYIQDNFDMPNASFKTREEALEVFREEYYQIVAESYFEETGVEIDLSGDGTIEPDNAGVYHIKNAARLELVTTGENGSKISWTVAPAGYLDLSTGKVTLPASGTVTLTLTATAKSGSEQKTRDLSVVLYSAPKQADELFTEIQTKLNEKSAFIQPVQIRGQKTVQDAMSYWLYENGYDDEGIEVSFVSAGTRATNFNGDTTAFIGENGVVTYYQGQAGTSSVNQVVYNNVQLKLTKDGAEKTIKATVHIGWDTDKAEELMNQALEQLSWENIRGQNTNEVSDETVADFSGTIVDGQVSEKLSVQRSFTFSGATVRIGYISLPSDAVTADWEDSRIYISPRRPDQGEEPTTFDLQLVTLFDDNLDDYTKEALKSRTSDDNTTLQNKRSFRITVAPQTESAATVLDKNLEEIYPTLMKDFYDKKTVIDMENVTADIQLPTATQMSNAGIFDYVFEDHILRFTSSNPDVLEVYGYRLMAYRPLPNEDPVDVTFTVEICKRGEKDADGKYTYGATLGKATFTLTIQPLTQKELDDAAALMKKLCTEEVYWNGIKGENTDKNNITKDLNSFDEIEVNSDGSVTYIRGAINKNFNRVEISELPGYDPMAVYGETWRLFRSSRPDVLKHENLVIREQPKFNTKVTIDSVMGYEKYARYYIKHVLGNRDDAEQYASFAQFYKQPISIEVTVTGTTGLDDPNPPTTFNAFVYVDAYKPDGTTPIDNFTAKYTLDKPYEYEVPYTGSPVTALEVMRDFFTNSGYTSNITASSYGAYIYTITDPNGVTLTAATDDRPYSGWMYTVGGKLAENMIDSEFIKDGDMIHFYFVENYYTDLDPDSDQYKQYKAMADDAIALIDAIPSEITSENAASYESAVKRARNAYDDLYAGIRDTMIPEESKQKLEEAEAKLAAYKDGSQIANVEALIDALPAAKRMALSDKDALEKAEAAYAALTEDQQAKVNETLVQKLADCRTKLDELLVDGGDDLAAAEAVEQLIRQTPADADNVTANYAQAIEKASEAYNALSTKARKLVASELSKRLTANEKALTANQKAAAKVDTLIEKLPEDAQDLTLSQSKSVTSAKNAYDKLTDAQKTFVVKDNVTRLNASVAKIAELQAEADKIADDKAAAAAVDKLVKALPKTGKVKTSDKAKIEAAEAAYAALTDDQKAYLTTDAEALIASARAELDAAIEEENAQIDASEYATILIRALPAAEDVTLADQEAIEAAREAYELGKDHVEKADLKLLTACEKALKKAIKQDEKDQKSAATFIAKIEKLPQPEEVLVKNKRAIEAVRKAYEKLNDNAKAYADANTEAMQKLSDCEAALEAAIEDEEKADAVEALIKKLPTVKRVKDDDEEAVQTAWEAYSELTAKQKDLIAAKNVEKLLALCEHFGIDTSEEETDVEALAQAQEEAELQAAAIEAFVLADDEDTADDAE